MEMKAENSNLSKTNCEKPLGEPKMEIKNRTFQDIVNRHCAENRHGIYGWFNLVDDAKEAGLELNIDISGLRRLSNGFYAEGTAKYEGTEQVFTISMTPEMFLVSSKPNEQGMKIFEGFAKLFIQKPDLVYRDNKYGQGLIYTAEWYMCMSEAKKQEMLEEARNDSGYEIINWVK